MNILFDSLIGQSKRRRILLIAVLVVALIVVSVFFYYNRDESLPTEAASTPFPSETLTDTGSALLVCFLDVGQGDCTFLRAPDGKTMLVDAGPIGSYGFIRDFLDALDVTHIDMAVISHLHSDHFGGMAEVIRHYGVEDLYMAPYDADDPDSSLYADLIAAFDEKAVSVHTIRAGVNTLLPWSEDTEVRVLAPYDVPYTEFNNTSLVLRVKYGDTAVMLTGDAEELSERLIVKAQKNHLLRANLLKVGHHGSADSSSVKFLNAVKPTYAVISVGADNYYGLPSQKILDRLAGLGIQIFRTDLDGTVCFALDGTNVRVIE